MPGKPPVPGKPSAAPAGRGARGPLRADLAPAAAIGAIMGFLADHEGSGPWAGVVVGATGCAAVLGLLVLKRWSGR